MVECTLSITHCLRLNLQLHTIDLVRTCRISSFCAVAWQLARFRLTRRIARSLGDSCASCVFNRRLTLLCELCMNLHTACITDLFSGAVTNASPCCAYVYANVVALKTDNKTCLHVCYDDNCRKLSVGIYDIWGIGIGMMDRIRVDQIFDGSRCG